MIVQAKQNFWLELLKLDSVKYVILAVLVVGLYFFFKWQAKEFATKRKARNSTNIDTAVIPKNTKLSQT